MRIEKAVVLEHMHRVNGKYVVVAIVAIAITFIINDGLGALTLGVVARRLFDAVADVFFDRGLGSSIE